MSVEKISVVLKKYIPEPAVEVCARWVFEKDIHLKITRGRASKYGDYRPLPKGEGHRITVNHDLNPYAFLITFIHEVAHLNAFISYKFRHEPHGKEWKHEYKLLLKDFLGKNIFPEEIESALKDYSANPAASSCSDPQLMRALRLFDKKEDEVYHLEDIPENTVFRLHQSRSGMTFQKGFRMRTRLHCIELKTKRVYYVNCMAEVKKVG